MLITGLRKLPCQVDNRSKQNLSDLCFKKSAIAREVHRDESMSGGHVWETPTEALRFTMQVGQRLVSGRKRDYGLIGLV